MGTRGMKWLRPLLLQAIVIGELTWPFFDEHSAVVWRAGRNIPE